LLESRKTIFSYFNRTKNALVSRQFLIKKIEDVSDYFFERLEDIKESFLRSFYSQVICCVMGDVNDFCGYIHSERNIFYQRLRFLDRNATHSIYKMTAVYHTVHYLASGTYKGADPADMLENFRCIFDLSETECAHFSELADIYLESEALFETEFTKFAARQIFGSDRIGPPMLSYVNYYFVHSYHQFISANQNYVA
jgi:hypothetical protein